MRFDDPIQYQCQVHLMKNRLNNVSSVPAGVSGEASQQRHFWFSLLLALQARLNGLVNHNISLTHQMSDPIESTVGIIFVWAVRLGRFAAAA
jgi:hypothetical protein